ncbi:hypothetical protein Q8F55_003530 [Vanrija albida]|uniref:NAD-dependent epimerase/dehydratase domain-containing protein n=1 Tax=Vanrija albida TaxID=181172 RepID=A0ABR3Q516_9TREE
MPHTNVLFTGATGYIGGTALYKYSASDIGHHFKNASVYALVRNPASSAAVEELNATPLVGTLDDAAAVEKLVLDNEISTIVHMADVMNEAHERALLGALAKVQTDNEKHYITIASGDSYGNVSKFGRHDPVSDLEDLYAAAAAAPPYMGRALETAIHDLAEEAGIKSYIVYAPLVYGKGLGFGNQTSVQIPAVIRGAYHHREANHSHPGDEGWSIVHVEDIADLFLKLLAATLPGGYPAKSGKAGGYYFAEAGFVSWKQLADLVAADLHMRGFVDSPQGKQFPGVPEDRSVPVQRLNTSPFYYSLVFAGLVNLHAQRGRSIGWTPKYDDKWLVEHFDTEVEPILAQNFKYGARVEVGDKDIDEAWPSDL